MTHYTRALVSSLLLPLSSPSSPPNLTFAVGALLSRSCFCLHKGVQSFYFSLQGKWQVRLGLLKSRHWFIAGAFQQCKTTCRLDTASAVLNVIKHLSPHMDLNFMSIAYTRTSGDSHVNTVARSSMNCGPIRDMWMPSIENLSPSHALGVRRPLPQRRHCTATCELPVHAVQPRCSVLCAYSRWTEHLFSGTCWLTTSCQRPNKVTSSML